MFADPAGSFTTAAAMVACAETALKKTFSTVLKGKRVVVFSSAGIITFASAVISAVEGAEAVLVGYDGPERVRKLAEEANARFAVKLGYADGSARGAEHRARARRRLPSFPPAPLGRGWVQPTSSSRRPSSSSRPT